MKTNKLIIGYQDTPQGHDALEASASCWPKRSTAGRSPPRCR